MSDTITALVTALTQIKTDMLTAGSQVIPVAVATLGLGIVTVFAVRLFKKLKD